MSTLTPGLYKAAVRGIPGDSIVMIDKDGINFSLAPDGSVRQSYVVIDARLLTVLDLGALVANGRIYGLVRYLRKGGWDFTADQIEEQTKPARIPEPGLWGVVEADGYRWVRFHSTAISRWSNMLSRESDWHSLPDPTLIREGLS